MSDEWKRELPTYLQHYLSLVSERDIVSGLQNSKKELLKVLATTTGEKGNYRYAEGKWTVNELLQHIIDTERVFQYRALCIARGEKQSLPGFDQDEYAKNVDVSNRTLEDVLSEFVVVRNSSIYLFKSLNNDQLNAVGLANGMKITPKAYGFLCTGHLRHHVNVLVKKYF